MGKSGQISGYMYSLAIHAGLCRGPVDTLVDIRSDGKIAWQGGVTETGQITIDEPYLYGGPQKEGGLNGTLLVYMGESTQTFSSYWKSMMGMQIPDFRGIVSTLWNGEICANNPYPKPWKYRVQRVLKGWYNDAPWYPERALIPIGGLLVEFEEGPTPGDQMNFNGHVATFINGPTDFDHISLGESVILCAQGFKNYINQFSSQLGISAVGTDNVLTVYQNVPWQEGQKKYTISRTGANPFFNSQATVNQMSATINPGAIHAMNPAHILYECATNPVWGRGLDPSQLDLRSFSLAADTLFREGLGLCLVWSRQAALSDFVQTVLNHVSGSLYTDRTTGLIRLKLLRADYEPSVVPLFDVNSGLLEIQDDETGASPNSISEVIVNYNDPISNTLRQARAQNLGVFQSTLNPTSVTVDYKGVASYPLASRLALRDLTIGGSGLKRMSVVLDRRGWAVQPADVVRINDPTRNISNLILRVLSVDAGKVLEGKITLKCTQDVFGMPADTFTQEQQSQWTPPNNTPAPATIWAAYEATYRDVIHYLNVTQQAAMTATTGAIATLAGRPFGLVSANYALYTAVSPSTPITTGPDGWAPSGTLAAACGPLDTTVTIDLMTATDLGNAPATPFAAWIDGEWCRVDGFDIDSGALTIARGCLDTVPQAHALGGFVLLADFFGGTDGQVYAVSEDVSVQVLSETMQGQLDPSLAPTDVVPIVARHNLPYPPGLVEVDGVTFCNITTLTPGDHVLTWAERNRVAQQDSLVDFTEATMTPEADTTYTVRVYVSGTLVRTASGITGTSWTYTEAMQTADGSPAQVTLQLETDRDGAVSFTRYNFAIPLGSGVLNSGFGYNFGYNWGN